MHPNRLQDRGFCSSMSSLVVGKNSTHEITMCGNNEVELLFIQLGIYAKEIHSMDMKG